MAETRLYSLAPNELYAHMGALIRKRREQLGLTQEELAKKVSLTRTSITNIEKGRQKLLVHTLLDLAEVLQVSPKTFLPSDEATAENSWQDKVHALQVGESGKQWIIETSTSRGK